MTTPTSPVKAGKILDTLGAMQSSMTRVGKSIAQFVMTSPHKVTQLSIADLSEEVNAGEASVIRFCRQLGYKGFQNFKMELAIELAMTDTDDNSTLLEAEIQKADDAHTIGLKLQGAISTVLSETLNLLDMERSGKASQHYDLQLYGAADEIVPKLIKGELDMAAIPANLAATLYQKTNGGIQVMAVNTLGVLYVVEKGDSIHSFADLKGRTILSTGKGTTPEYVLRYLLTKNGLDPDKDVKIEYYSEASEVTAQMAASKKDAIAVLPQPYVTAAQLKDSSLRVVLDLTKEWNKVCDTQLITGVTVVRTEYAKENPDIVANFLRDYEKSIKAAQTDVAGTAALCEETGVVAKKAIAQKALPQCNIVYRVGDEMKADVNAYLKVLYDASPAAVGGKLPDANFYYTKATPGQVFWKSVQRSFQ